MTASAPFYICSVGNAYGGSAPHGATIRQKIHLLLFRKGEKREESFGILSGASPPFFAKGAVGISGNISPAIS